MDERVNRDAGAGVTALDPDAELMLRVRDGDGVSFGVLLDKHRLPVVHFLYRMIQEILNNILKHSEAKNINISIFREKENIHIQIADDGKGFDKSDSGFRAGMGLNNLNKRAAMIGAALTIDSKINKGTSVELIFHSL